MSKLQIPKGGLIITDFEPSKGSEIRKRRPAVVISRNEYNQSGNLLIVCPITTTSKRRPYLVPIEHSSLLKSSKVNCSQVYTIDYSDAGERNVQLIGEIEKRDLYIIAQYFLLNFNF